MLCMEFHFNRFLNFFSFLQKVLRELKMKKPQLNELVHTAEVLKGDVKRQQLQEKGEYMLENKNYQRHRPFFQTRLKVQVEILF